MNTLSKDSIWLIPLLSLFVALGPLSTDMYLPALPAMVEIFGTNLSSVQLTISSYLAGFAVFHLVCGPLADRYGRKPVLLGGLVIFVVAAWACAQAETIEALITARFWQGVGACTGPTLARAMVRDIHGPREAAKALAHMSAIMALAPVVAPTLGGWMLHWFPWNSTFWLLCGIGLLGILLLTLLLPETLEEPQTLRLGSILRNYANLLKHRGYMTYVVAGSSLYAGAFAFISGVSFVLIDLMGVEPGHFGPWFMFIVVGYMLGNIFTGRYASQFTSRQLMFGGAAMGVVSGLVMIGLSLLEVNHPLAIIIPVAFYTGSVGITMPHSMAGALGPFPRMAGTASALMGFVQMGLAALSGFLVGAFLTTTALPMVLTITGCALVSLILFALVPQEEAEESPPES